MGENDPPFDGDPAWRVERTLRDGTRVTIRPVTPSDREELRHGFRELSPASQYSRFLSAVAEPTEPLLTYLTDVDQTNHVAIGATLTSPDLKTERGIGIARFVRLAERHVAEGAITVVDDMQRRGVATVLLRELVRAAQARGIVTMRSEVLASNAAMAAILEQAGAKVVARELDAIVYELELPREERSLLAILRGAAETMAIRFR